TALTNVFSGRPARPRRWNKKRNAKGAVLIRRPGGLAPAAAALWLFLGDAASPALLRAQVPPRAASPSAEEAFRLRRSGVFLTAEGLVVRVLKDDRKGIPHQRFILRLDSGLTLLVLHNTAVAPRVPVHRGDRLRVRGEYRWNKKGGLLHFTHRPAGRAARRPDVGPGGWIRTPDGRLFR
ncbi:MAG: DUF3465 domain-containing protein, partial [Nitrospinota bacterium]